VRRTIVTTARHHGVNPDLALAISWQESGWQQRRVSSAQALGAMQVLPSTARWMSTYVGKRLNPRDLQHNVTAGVVLIKVLRSQARRKVAVAGYYQGLAGVRRHGMYRDTKRYVANVVALQERIAGGWNPA
jgi:soluble lytic murein transglycosylase-like protein